MHTGWAYLAFVLSLSCFVATLFLLVTGFFFVALEDSGDRIIALLLLAGGPTFLLIGLAVMRTPPPR
jgi:hypothetical protein